MKVYMTNSIKLAIGTVSLFAIAVLGSLTSGCVHTPVVTDGVTNIVTTIDPAKLEKVKSAVDPVASSALRRAIKNSPQHAAEISAYARALGGVCCDAVASGSVSPGAIVAAGDRATANLQLANIPPEIIDAKNGLFALYLILWDDNLTIALPHNKWPVAVLGIFCDSIDRALKDSGQAGVK